MSSDLRQVFEGLAVPASDPQARMGELDRLGAPGEGGHLVLPLQRLSNHETPGATGGTDNEQLHDGTPQLVAKYIMAVCHNRRSWSDMLVVLSRGCHAGGACSVGSTSSLASWPR